MAPRSEAYLQVVDEVCDVLDSHQGQTSLACHWAEKGRGKDHSREHVDTRLEMPSDAFKSSRI